MRLAPAAVLAELDSVRVVPLGLLSLVVASLAFLTSERHADSDVSACHCSSRLFVRRPAKKNPAGQREVRRSLASDRQAGGCGISCTSRFRPSEFRISFRTVATPALALSPLVLLPVLWVALHGS